MTVIDALGNRIEIGDIIVYNLGGELAVGKVTAIKPYKLYGRDRIYVEAQVLEDTGWDTPNKGISRIRNHNSIIRVRSLAHWKDM